MEVLQTSALPLGDGAARNALWRPFGRVQTRILTLAPKPVQPHSLAAPAIPLPVAIMWTSAAALFDLVIAGAVQRDVGMFRSVTGTWLSLAMILRQPGQRG